jgi:hypothetical protein
VEPIFGRKVCPVLRDGKGLFGYCFDVITSEEESCDYV